MVRMPMSVVRPRQHGPAWAVAALLLAGLCLVLFAKVALDSLGDGGGSDPAAERRTLVEYEEAIEPILEDGGRVVALGMRPGVADIDEANYDDETLRGMATGWTNEMRRVRERFLEVEPPGFLKEAAEGLERALDEYIETGEALAGAARASGEDRHRFIERAVALGEHADDVYDAAWEVVAGHRARLGMPPGEHAPRDESG